MQHETDILQYQVTNVIQEFSNLRSAQVARRVVCVPKSNRPQAIQFLNHMCPLCVLQNRIAPYNNVRIEKPTKMDQRLQKCLIMITATAPLGFPILLDVPFPRTAALQHSEIRNKQHHQMKKCAQKNVALLRLAHRFCITLLMTKGQYKRIASRQVTFIAVWLHAKEGQKIYSNSFP